MLETRDLVKIYKPKKGVPVTALNKVSLKLPDRGMVFLLGKSGSGKSTLLNVLGGLDSYNSGEIIIKGVSSKSFRQKHFDSYRNTYIGFIFQEYNLLEEFSVGANIALAIELQNRKASDSEINDILKKVDLEGFGNRKPNELSGGQKQRVAIARALVKNPQIIMADEPTGALDSNTGNQVFDTLKKLSSEKLVLVVSHDREFAEQYADRIIELSDGVVISDLEHIEQENLSETEEKIEFSQNTVSVPCGYHLTEQDRIAINEYIDKLQNGELKINLSNGKANTKRFTKTDQTKIKIQDSSAFKLIKSKLPLKNAFKLGVSGLKHKKIRLCITIFLSCIAFGLFGLADTFGAYNHVETCTNSLMDSGVEYVAVSKAKLIGTDKREYWRDYGYNLSEQNLAEIEKNTGVKMHGVYYPIGTELDFSQNTDESVKLSESEFNIYYPSFSGFADISYDIIKEMNFKLLAGNLPSGERDEIAISEYIFEVFKKAKYSDGTYNKNGDKNTAEIKSYLDILGKKIEINGKQYTVTAVIDTNFNLERYLPLLEKKENQTEAQNIVDYVLYSEFNYAKEYSYSSIAMTGSGHTKNLISKRPNVANITEGYLSYHSDNFGMDFNYISKLSSIPQDKIIWTEGKKEVLKENEIIVSADTINCWEGALPITEDTATGEKKTDYASILKEGGNIVSQYELFNDGEFISKDGNRIVGIIEDEEFRSTVITADSLYNMFTEGSENYYSYGVGAMPDGKEEIKNMVAFCYNEDTTLRFPIQNSVTYELDAINEALKEASKIFLYIGLGFALFAAIMLANFIAISISYKKQEIGILRAIGSRSNDVFRIFFAESFVIAMINFVLSAVGVFVATIVINNVVRSQTGALITLLSFTPRQFVLLLAVSIAVAFAASYIPVKKIASKRPIDAIRNR